MARTLRAAPPATLCGALIGLLLLGAVGEAVLDQGGYRAPQRILFGGLALAAALIALLQRDSAARRAARSGTVISLWLLGILGAASALWTVGVPGEALRWGLVTAGYGAVVTVCAWLSAKRGGARAVAAGITGLASISAVVGLYGAALHSGPYSDYVRGIWRPGGTVEYSDAMALLAVSGLPAALSAMCSQRRALAALGAMAGLCLAAALALDLTRLEVGLALLLVLAALASPGETVRASRLRAGVAIGCLATMGLVTHLLYGQASALNSRPHPTRELLVLAGLALASLSLWLLSSALLPGPAAASARPRRVGRRTAGALVAAMLLLGGAVAAAGGTTAPRYVAHGSAGGFFHGRLHLWKVSLETAVHRPLGGYGADAYLAATLTRQGPFPIRFAHSLPLEAAVELGVGGLLLVLWLYAASARALWRRRRDGAMWLLGPAAAGFLVASLVDWPWHLAGSGAVWAAALGGLIGRARDMPPGKAREFRQSTRAGLGPITERTS